MAVKTGKITLVETMLAKIIPLVIVIPLWLRMQTYFPDFKIVFDIEQGAYVLAISIIVVIAFIEFRIAQGNERGLESLNLGSGLAALIVIVGLILLAWILVTEYKNFLGSNFLNDIISFYLMGSIIVIGIQAIREIAGKRKVLKAGGYLG